MFCPPGGKLASTVAQQGFLILVSGQTQPGCAIFPFCFEFREVKMSKVNYFSRIFLSEIIELYEQNDCL